MLYLKENSIKTSFVQVLVLKSLLSSNHFAEYLIDTYADFDNKIVIICFYFLSL